MPISVAWIYRLGIYSAIIRIVMESINNRISKRSKGFVVLFFVTLICSTLSLSSCVTRKIATLPTYEHIHSPVGERYLERPKRAEVDSLIAIYGTNKCLIDEYDDILIVALSYYPELKDVHIKFEYSDEKTTMASRPSKLIFPRTYKILINRDKYFDGILSIRFLIMLLLGLLDTNWLISLIMKASMFLV